MGGSISGMVVLGYDFIKIKDFVQQVMSQEKLTETFVTDLEKTLVIPYN